MSGKTQLEIVDYIERIRERTMRLIACIPPDKIDWRYQAGKFSLSAIIRHRGAIERWMFAENAQLRPSRYPGHGRELADGYDATFQDMPRMHDESMAIFHSLSDEDPYTK